MLIKSVKILTIKFKKNNSDQHFQYSSNIFTARSDVFSSKVAGLTNKIAEAISYHIIFIGGKTTDYQLNYTDQRIN